MVVRVLVSGAGIGGCVSAYWLGRLGPAVKVTVLESAPSIRDSGQNIDIQEGPARHIVRKMGLWDQIKAAGTGEQGSYIVDSHDRNWAKNPLDPAGRVPSMTNEVEIVRGTLAKIFYEASKPLVQYRFGESVTRLESRDDGVRVSFRKGEPEDYDLVVGADGLYSRTRSLAFAESGLRSLNQTQAYFTIRKPYRDLWARIYQAPGGRAVLLRPDVDGTVHMVLSVRPKPDSALAKYHELPLDEQKLEMKRLFEGAGWECDQIIEEMMRSDDCYFGDVAQIRLPRYSTGRIVLVGDAGYAPSQYSGMGTSLAIVGGYALAGEVGRATVDGKLDVAAALDRYEASIRPYVEEIQDIPSWAPRAFSPDSWIGILCVRLFGALLTRSGVLNLVPLLSKDGATLDKGKLDLPAYNFAALK